MFNQQLLQKSKAETYKIHKVSKQVHPDIGISSKAMSITNGDPFEKIATGAASLLQALDGRGEA